MAEWWDSLSAVQRVFAYFALPATLVLIIQSVLVLFGMGHDSADAGHGGVDVGHAHADFGHAHADVGHAHGGLGHAHAHGHEDDGSDGFALFSIRGLVAFFSVGGWAGIVLDGAGAGLVLTVLASLAAGFAALYLVALLFRLTAKLQSSGNIELSNAVGKSAKVYIPIPGGERGTGKVTLTLQERFVECDALTRAPQGLKTGEFVRVTAVVNANTLVVEPEIVSVAQAAEQMHGNDEVISLEV
ncbi:MAG: hypothetical protein ABFC62_08355 [Clostridiaceae bacterium]|nr:hypothetical protein [Eubacteriales bacterium]